MPVELTDDFQLRGDEVHFDAAPALKKRGDALITAAATGQPVSVDLAGLDNANSLTVALLLQWYRTAHALGLSIVFLHLSQDLRNIITFSGLSEILLEA
ncbi:MAG: STAS domain-containing protein [Pseudomonadales bacterium]